MSLTTTHFCVLSLRQTHFLYPIETFSVFIQTHVFLKFSYHIYWTTSLYSNRKNISFEWQWKWKWSCSVVSNSLWPYDCTPPGSSIHGISQARMLEWGPVPSPGDLPDLGIEPGTLALQADSLPTQPPGKPNLCPFCQISDISRLKVWKFSEILGHTGWWFNQVFAGQLLVCFYPLCYYGIVRFSNCQGYILILFFMKPKTG